jgi:sporulation protein YlmC with PRC-barrel domain
MALNISELYGKTIITSAGSVLGEVRGVVINFESGEVAYLLLKRLQDLTRSADLRNDFRKNSISYERVSKVGQTIIVDAPKVAKEEASDLEF